MADVTIFASANDGFIEKQDNSSWAATRDATSGTHNDTATYHGNAIRVQSTSGRGGSTTRIIRRSFFDWDTSDISITPSAAILYIFGSHSTSADIFVVKSEQQASLHNDDFNAITGWTSGDNSGNVTKYSAEVESWNNGSYNTITLNAVALSNMVSLDTFKICLIEADYDLTDTEPSGAYYDIGLRYSEYSDTSSDPKIIYTEGVATTAADIAPFFGAYF